MRNIRDIFEFSPCPETHFKVLSSSRGGNCNFEGYTTVVLSPSIIVRDTFILPASHFPYCSVSKPVSLSHVDCAAGLGSGLKAYTALHTQATIVPGNVVLITGAASVSDYWVAMATFLNLKSVTG